MDPEQFERADYILVRHGVSEYNYKWEVAAQKYGKDSPEVKAIQTDPGNFDPALHEIGILQAEA